MCIREVIKTILGKTEVNDHLGDLAIDKKAVTM
jgi:hypothetical protein